MHMYWESRWAYRLLWKKKINARSFLFRFLFGLNSFLFFFYGYCFSLYRFEFLFPSFEMVLVGEWRIDFFELLSIFSQYINCKLTIDSL